jgi:hypothetical protein
MAMRFGRGKIKSTGMVHSRIRGILRWHPHTPTINIYNQPLNIIAFLHLD